MTDTKAKAETTKQSWSRRFPGEVGYYWMKSPALDDEPIICEVSGGAPGVTAVVYFSGEGPISKSQFQRAYRRAQFYGPLVKPE